MAPDRPHQTREAIANVLLAFQMLLRPRGMRERHLRIVQLGLKSAQKLAQLLLVERGGAEPGMRAT
jgi:hypothetical protein